ncbi:MAG: hypothetical protein LR000_01630 [Candidatus Pacebacteria bacterium]|nr:hypothetical protein [Candidatus Paceibacterota bacterium]
MKKEKGTLVTIVLVFSLIFLILMGSIISLILAQYRASKKKSAYELAFQIAEAGINYYRWRLAHAPQDFCDGVPPGSEKCQNPPYGPFVHEYKDPEGNVVGEFVLWITPPSKCYPWAIIESEGYTLEFPETKRKLKAKWAKPSLAKYAFLTNSNVWIGEEGRLKGPLHSNGGIRMDGEQNSLATSAKETYICGPEHGCDYWRCNDPCRWTASGCECPGIWGEGKGKDLGLWDFPVPAIDFDLISRDLATLKEEAQNAGFYFGPSGRKGYHIEFLSNGKFYLYKVTRLQRPVYGWDGENLVIESNSIKNKTLLGMYDLPSDCAPIFVEDNLWVSGDVAGRVTVVAARLPEIPDQLKKIIIHDNINYVTEDAVLGLISQSDILIPLYSPNRLEIEAVLLAQRGRVFRYYYPNLPWEPYRTYAIRDYIKTYGSIITNKIWTFTWVGWQGRVISGYRETEMSYNPDLTYSPPPYFPTHGEYEIFEWEEE